MIYNDIIYGKYIYLRSVNEDDAEFIVNIRNDISKNQFVHSVENDVSKEIAWIKQQRECPGDYFFSVIRKNDDQILGNIAICNISFEKNEAELGRWVSYGSSIENLESVILSHDFAYDIIGLDNVYTKTLMGNKKVVSFWKRFGGRGEEDKLVGDKLVYYNEVNKEEYKNKIQTKLINLLEG